MRYAGADCRRRVKESQVIDALTAYIDCQSGSLGGAGNQRILLGLLRLLARGEAVAAEDVAGALDIPPDRVRQVIAGLPASWTETGTEGRITGFGGLGLNPTPHRVMAGGRTLYAWCAFDSLFLAGLLGRTIDVESPCLAGGDAIRLSVSPRRVEHVRPEAAVMSFVTPDAAARRADLRRVFCGRVHFFASGEAASPWLSDNADGVVVSLEEAHALGRRRNAALFADALAA